MQAPDFVRGKPNCRGARFGDARFGFDGTTILVSGTGANVMGQAPEQKLMWLYTDDDLWFVVDGTTRQIHASEKTQVDGTTVTMGGMTAEVMWQ